MEAATRSAIHGKEIALRKKPHTKFLKKKLYYFEKIEY